MELARLALRLDALTTAHGGLVLLSGEPGIGKSCLLDAVADLADARGLRVVCGRCEETSGAPPYWPWMQIFAALPGSVPDEGLLASVLQGRAGAAAGSDRFQLFQAATESLGQLAAARPLVVILDDLHRADDASLALLRFVVPALRRSRMLVIGAYRSTEVPVQHPLSLVLGELSGDVAFELIEIPGLSLSETAALAERIPGADAVDLDEVHERTAGNPFFLAEVLRLGRLAPGGVPTTVQAAIQARLRRLPVISRELLALAAVLGRDVDGPLLAALAEQPLADVQDQLAPAVAAGLLTDGQDGTGHRFVHILVQSALYATHTARVRGLLHDRVVLALQRRDAEAPDDLDAARDARLAAHAVCATGVPGGRERAFELVCRAARSAVASLADEQAADWYAKALELQAPDDESTTDLLLELGRCAGRAGRLHAAREAYERAWTLAAAHGWQARLVSAALGLGEVVVSAGVVDAALVRVLERTLDQLGPEADAHRITVTARLATELYWGEQLPRSRALAAQALADARAHGDRRALALSLAAAQFVLRGPSGIEQRLEIGQELTGLSVELGDAEAELQARRMLIPDLLQRDPVRVHAQLAVLADLAHASRRPLAQWYVLVFRALRATMLGADDATTLVEQAYALGRRIGAQPAAIYACGQRFALRRLLDATAIEQQVRLLAARYPVLSVFKCQLAVLLAEAGRVEEAAALLEELTAGGCAALPLDSLWLANVGLLSEVAAALEDTGRAEELHAHLSPYAGRVVMGGVPMWFGAVDRYLALTATTLQRWDQADAAFQAALRLHEAWGAAPLAAQTMSEHAAMLRRRGAPADRRRAARLAMQAAALISPPATSGEPLPAGSGAAGRQAGTSARPAVTDREAEVLQLVAGGASNKEIASQLRLSVHTIERHIANLYVKIGARNRADATAYVLNRSSGPGAPRM